MSVAHCTQTARDRQQWRTLVHSVILDRPSSLRMECDDDDDDDDDDTISAAVWSQCLVQSYCLQPSSTCIEFVS